MKISLSLKLLLSFVLFGIILLVIFPFWFVISSSIKISSEIISQTPNIIPHSFTLEHYVKLLATSNYSAYILNSLIVATFSTALTLLLSIPAAYAFFRMRFIGREFFFRMVLLAYAFPSIVIIIPLFGIFAKLGLIDNRLALVLVNTTFALPFAIWLLRSFFASIPKEIEEAALLDGGSPIIILYRIMLPLIAPGIGAVAVFSFVTGWTEYVFASVMILSDKYRTLPVGFSGIIGQYQIDWGLLLAGVSLSILPVVILFTFIGRWFVAGLTEGAVK